MAIRSFRRARPASWWRIRPALRPWCSSASSSSPALASTVAARPMFKTDDAISLDCDVRGEGIPLVLVNGLPDSKDGWGETAGLLARDFRVVTYNLRNQGPIDSGGGEY